MGKVTSTQQPKMEKQHLKPPPGQHGTSNMPISCCNPGFNCVLLCRMIQKLLGSDFWWREHPHINIQHDAGWSCCPIIGPVKVSPEKHDQNFKVFQTYVDHTLFKEKNAKSNCNKTSEKKKDR